MALESLAEFSTIWIRPRISADEIATLEKKGFIERRNPKSFLFRLTAKGEIAKYVRDERKKKTLPE